MPLFDRYLFADYSGASHDQKLIRGIKLYGAHQSEQPKPILSEQKQGAFSRDLLRSTVESHLSRATAQGERVIFGFDHQLSWPLKMQEIAGMRNLKWREFIQALASGKKNLPALDMPKSYCSAFNDACGAPVFWSAINGARYQIPRRASDSALPGKEAYRLTELQGDGMKPANRVGDLGSVGGQTLCGLKQIAKISEREDVAFWPFDGLSIDSASYERKHIAVELYPTAQRPKDIPQTDDHDAYFSCLTLQTTDRKDELGELLTLSDLTKVEGKRVLKEGWVVGTKRS